MGEESVERVARIAAERGLRVVTAESLTSGTIAARLGAGPDAASWFGGGVVAYQEPVKFGLLGVDEGPVVTARCAHQLGQGALRLFDADVAVSSTGVGGPDPSEGKPAGTVFVAVTVADDVVVRQLDLEGEPAQVLDQTCAAAVDLLLDVLDGNRDGQDDVRRDGGPT